MEYSLPKAVEHMSDPLQLFVGPGMDSSISMVKYQEYRPTSQLTHGTPITFTIPGQANDYLNLRSTCLNMKVKITKSNGAAIGMPDKVAFVNMPMHSLFRQVDVKIQQVPTTTEVGTNYPYKAIMDTLLEETVGSLDTQLFYKDTYMFMDSTQVNTGQNGGLTDRWTLTNKGQICEMEGPLHVDIMKQDRLLLNGVRMDITLFPSTDEFVFMVGTNVSYKVEIMDVILKMEHNRMSPTILNAHSENLMKEQALYPYTRSEIKVFNIPQGSFTWSMDNVFQDKIPTKVVIGLVSEAGYSGTTKKNPFNFANWDVNYAAFLVDGQSRPAQPFQPNYGAGIYASAFNSLTQKIDRTRIKHLEYPTGYCMYMFQIEHTDVIKRGNSRIELRMSKALPESVSVIVYGHFPAMMQIDGARNVVIDA